MTLKKTLTIAGSDTSGGAGIQADLKTFQEHGVYGMTALTTVVTMDPNNHWHHNVHPLASQRSSIVHRYTGSTIGNGPVCRDRCHENRDARHC